MSIIKSFFLPKVPAGIKPVDIANRFNIYGQICRIDLCNQLDGDKSRDYFIHFYTFAEHIENGYLVYQHEHNLPGYVNITDECAIAVLPYKSKFNNKVFLEKGVGIHTYFD